jgi:adenosylmethionine-8-amino-7-oxononanoate aminotransferase
MKELAYFPVWSYAHPRAVELAERLVELAPGDLNRVFFTSSGGEAIESAWKAIKQHFKLVGKPMKHKAISRYVAYHGTPQGALSLTGIPDAKKFFEPLVPGSIRVPNTNPYRLPDGYDTADERFGIWAADRIEEAIIMEGPETVCAVFLEPVQNSGGCFPPPPGYLQRVREICDQYDVFMVADETICAFGRIGDYFSMSRFGVTPDIITCAKGMTSGYAPLGAMIRLDTAVSKDAPVDSAAIVDYLAENVCTDDAFFFRNDKSLCELSLTPLGSFTWGVERVPSRDARARVLSRRS